MFCGLNVSNRFKMNKRMAAIELTAELRKKARKVLFKSTCAGEDAAALEREYGDVWSLNAASLRQLLVGDRYAPFVEGIARAEQRDAQASLLAEQHRLLIDQMWLDARAMWANILKVHIEQVNDPRFEMAVPAMMSSLSHVFGARSACILIKLPPDFVITNGKSSIAVAIRRMKEVHAKWFSDLDSFDDFFKSMTTVIPSLAFSDELEALASTKVGFNAMASLLTIETAVPSEFHPTKQLLMRERYWGMIRELQACLAAVVVGDLGVGKSSLLRVVIELFVHEWPEELRNAAKAHHLQMGPSKAKPFCEWRGVFWIMESGQFQYALKHDVGCVLQGEGVYGRGDVGNDFWRRRDVVLLVDGSVPTAFQAKTSDVFVFASPRPANYHRMMKATNAVRLTLPPWSEDEVIHLMKHCKQAVLDRMMPYVEYNRSKIFGTDQDESKAEYSTTQGFLDSKDPAIASAGAAQSADSKTALPEPAQSVWDYDEVRSLRRSLATDDRLPTEREARWKFLQDHVVWRHRLVGGRIGLLLNPSETFAALRKKVASAINAGSVESSPSEIWIDSPRYEPSILYSLVPASNPREPPEMRAASPTIAHLIAEAQESR